LHYFFETQAKALPDLLIKKKYPVNYGKPGKNRYNQGQSPPNNNHNRDKPTPIDGATNTTLHANCKHKPTENPLTRTSWTSTIAGEKKPRLLWEEQTRDAPTMVKKHAIHEPCA
jgi:hypothetical protein